MLPVKEQSSLLDMHWNRFKHPYMQYSIVDTLGETEADVEQV